MVCERLRALFKRRMRLDWETGQLRATFQRTDGAGTQYNAAQEASGLLHLVAILAALYDDEVGVLLLDEPEASLHPQLQEFLLREIKRVAGDPLDKGKKIVIVATHSTAFLDLRHSQHLARMVFFTDAGTAPLQVTPDRDELRSKRLRSLLVQLGQSHKEAFFAPRALLVEGPSDSVICRGLERNLGLHLGVAGTQLIPVGGKDVVPSVVKLMKLVGKKAIVLADLDYIADGREFVGTFASDKQAMELAQHMGHRDFAHLAREAHNRFCQTVEDHWEDIAAHAMSHSYWTNRKAGEDETIARRRAAMAVLMISAESDRRGWRNQEKWNGLHRMLDGLFTCLEGAGCFVLRKGTIEHYYQCVKPESRTDKVIAAIEEADAMEGKDRDWLRDRYGDIVRALDYASQAPLIDEASSVAVLLLAVAAPALCVLARGADEAELSAMARSNLGDKAALFSVSKTYVDEEVPALQIDLVSEVLDIEGFPITLAVDCNVNKEVEHELGLTRNR